MTTTAGSAAQPANESAFNGKTRLGDYPAIAETAMSTETFTPSSSGAEQHAKLSTDSHTASQSIAGTKKRNPSTRYLLMYMLDFLKPDRRAPFAMTNTIWKLAVEEWSLPLDRHYFSLEWLLMPIQDYFSLHWLLMPSPDEEWSRQSDGSYFSLEWLMMPIPDAADSK